MHMNTILFVLLFAFIIYRIYLRVRRSIGWQQLKSGRMQVLTTLSLIIGLLFLVEGTSHLISLISDIAGIAFGVILASYGAAMTRLEQRGGQMHYRPNTWVSTLVTAIFLGRLLFRLYGMYASGSVSGPQGGSALSSLGYDPHTAWASGLMLIMFAYFATYYILLLQKQKYLLQTSLR